MTDIANFDIETDPTNLAQNAFDFIRERIDGWEPASGNFEVILIQALARMIAELRDVAADVPLAIFKFFGATVMNLPPDTAAPASVDSTWTAIDDAGYIVPANATVKFAINSEESVAFEVANEVNIPAGETSTATGEVLLIAIEPGEVGNNLTEVTLLDSLAWVEGVTVVGPTSGGQDDEDESDYLLRLIEEMTLLSTSPVTPADVAVVARSVAGVYRVLVLDGYNPDDDTEDNEKFLTVIGVDVEGNAVSAGVKSALIARLTGTREANFEWRTDDPTYTAVDVAFAGKVVEGFDAATVEADAEAAVTAYLTPANWGFPTSFGVTREWRQVDKVRLMEVAEVVNRVNGFDYVTSLTIEGAAADFDLTGRAPMPTPGTVAGTVT